MNLLKNIIAVGLLAACVNSPVCKGMEGNNQGANQQQIFSDPSLNAIAMYHNEFVITQNQIAFFQNQLASLQNDAAVDQNNHILQDEITYYQDLITDTQNHQDAIVAILDALTTALKNQSLVSHIKSKT